jgi:hypothetical protein
LKGVRGVRGDQYDELRDRLADIVENSMPPEPEPGEPAKVPVDLKDRELRERRNALRDLEAIRSILEENARELATRNLSVHDALESSDIWQRDIEWNQHGVPGSPADEILDLAQDVESLFGALYGHAGYLRTNRGSILTDLAIIYNADGCQLWQTGGALAKLVELFQQIFTLKKQVEVKRPDYLIELALAALPSRDLVDKVISTTMLLAGEIRDAVRRGRRS